MRKLTYYVACTVDRFIARPDGSFADFPTQGEHFADLLASFPETVPGHLRGPLGITGETRRFDAVLMGRHTYEVGLKIGVTNPYPHLKQYAFSRSLSSSPDPNVELVSGDALAKVRELKQQPGLGLWLCGGGALAAALFPEIDELILKVNPFLLGSGIPLFAGDVGKADLDLADAKFYRNGFQVLHYLVKAVA